MKNISRKGRQLNLPPFQNQQALNFPDENVVKEYNQAEKPVIYDECGDTLWDDVLAQDEIQNVENNG